MILDKQWEGLVSCSYIVVKKQSMLTTMTYCNLNQAGECVSLFQKPKYEPKIRNNPAKQGLQRVKWLDENNFKDGMQAEMEVDESSWISKRNLKEKSD